LIGWLLKSPERAAQFSPRQRLGLKNRRIFRRPERHAFQGAIFLLIHTRGVPRVAEALAEAQPRAE